MLRGPPKRRIKERNFIRRRRKEKEERKEQCWGTARWEGKIKRKKRKETGGEKEREKFTGEGEKRKLLKRKFTEARENALTSPSLGAAAPRRWGAGGEKWEEGPHGTQRRGREVHYL